MVDYICAREYVDTRKENSTSERMELGTETAGIIIDITKDGLEINGYYADVARSPYKGNLSKPIEITWESLYKIKEDIANRKANGSYTIDANPSEEYINSLPKVHINDKMYFVDIYKKEMRPCDRSNLVYKMVAKTEKAKNGNEKSIKN